MKFKRINIHTLRVLRAFVVSPFFFAFFAAKYSSFLLAYFPSYSLLINPLLSNSATKLVSTNSSGL